MFLINDTHAVFFLSQDRRKNHFDIILEVKSTNTHERSTVNAKFKDGRQKRMTNAIFVTLSHEDSHVKIRVLWLVQLISWGENGNGRRRRERLATRLPDQSLSMVSLLHFPRCFGGLLKDGSCFKRKKLHKLFTKKSRKLERTLTSWSVPDGCQDNKGSWGT